MEQVADVVLAGTPEHRGAADLVAVELEDRQHGAVATWIEKAHAFPRTLEGTGLGLAVTDDAGGDEVRVVEDGPERVDERVAELTALVDRAGGRHADVAGDAARGGELPHQAEQPGLVQRDRRVDLRVRTFEIDVGDDGRAAVAGTGHVEDVA